MNIYSDTVLEAVKHHHENYDGSGYPSNLKGIDIPFPARILRVSDVFSALVSERQYRAAFDVDTAIDLMIDEVKNFDMHIFMAFLTMVHDDEFNEVQHYIKEINDKSKNRAQQEKTRRGENDSLDELLDLNSQLC